MNAAELVVSYINAGVGVLPLHTMRDGRCTCRRPGCEHPAKHPLTRHGKDDATTDPGQVSEWLGQYPDCNWGVRPPVGVVVLDVDPRNGGDVELANLEARHGVLPATLTARTGSGGLHIWLSYNGPTRGKLCTGVDVKSNSGYLVAPPSLHATGGTYQWIDQRPAEHAPRWVRTILNPPVARVYTGTGVGDVAPLARFVADAPQGERSNRLYWAACRAHEKGLDTAALADAAVSVGLTAPAAQATIRSAENAPPRRATGRLQPLEQFAGKQAV